MRQNARATTHAELPLPRLPAITATRSAIGFLGLYLLGVLPSLGQSLVETHAHRQTQTAYTALLYAEHGIDLLRPPLPVLGPPGIIPQEFPLFQAIGALVINLGIGPDMAMRLVGLATFLLSAWLLYLLARGLMSQTASLIVLAAFLFNPHAWIYGRTSLIEYLATAGSIGFLYFGIRWMDSGKAASWIGAVLMGTLGIVAKITTGGFYLLPILLLRSRDGRWAFRRPTTWALVLIPAVIGLVWSSYAQAVREETPAALFLSMDNQYGWFFGSLGQRLDVGSWRVPITGLLALTGSGLLAWAPLAVARARAHPQRPFLLAMLALVAFVPLVLFNLYAIHDYYLAAVAPINAIGIGLGFEWLREHWRSRWTRRLGVMLAGAWVATIIGMYPSWSIIYGTPGEEAGAMRIASFIREHSEPDDWVVLEGWGWNSTFLYYARRQGLAVPSSDPNLEAGSFEGQDLSDIDFDAILADPVFGPFIRCDFDANCTVEQRP